MTEVPPPTTPAAPPARPSSLSFVHLVLALFGVALLAAVGIPAWFSRPEVTLDNAAQLLAEDVQEAQNRAALTRSAVSLRFLPQGDGYEVLGQDGEPLGAKLGNGPFRRQYSYDAVFRGVKIESFEGWDDGSMRFDTLGFLEEGGRVVLTFRGERRELVLAERTGRVTIATLEGSPQDGKH